MPPRRSAPPRNRSACGHVDNAHGVIAQAHRLDDENHPGSLTHLTGYRIREPNVAACAVQEANEQAPTIHARIVAEQRPPSGRLRCGRSTSVESSDVGDRRLARDPAERPAPGSRASRQPACAPGGGRLEPPRRHPRVGLSEHAGARGGCRGPLHSPPVDHLAGAGAAGPGQLSHPVPRRHADDDADAGRHPGSGGDRRRSGSARTPSIRPVRPGRLRRDGLHRDPGPHRGHQPGPGDHLSAARRALPPGRCPALSVGAHRRRWLVRALLADRPSRPAGAGAPATSPAPTLPERGSPR